MYTPGLITQSEGVADPFDVERPTSVTLGSTKCRHNNSLVTEGVQKRVTSTDTTQRGECPLRNTESPRGSLREGRTLGPYNNPTSEKHTSSHVSQRGTPREGWTLGPYNNPTLETETSSQIKTSSDSGQRLTLHNNLTRDQGIPSDQFKVGRDRTRLKLTANVAGEVKDKQSRLHKGWDKNLHNNLKADKEARTDKAEKRPTTSKLDKLEGRHTSQSTKDTTSLKHKSLSSIHTKTNHSQMSNNDQREERARKRRRALDDARALEDITNGPQDSTTTTTTTTNTKVDISDDDMESSQSRSQSRTRIALADMPSVLRLPKTREEVAAELFQYYSANKIDILRTVTDEEGKPIKKMPYLVAITCIVLPKDRTVLQYTQSILYTLAECGINVYNSKTCLLYTSPSPRD